MLSESQRKCISIVIKSFTLITIAVELDTKCSFASEVLAGLLYKLC